MSRILVAATLTVALAGLAEAGGRPGDSRTRWFPHFYAGYTFMQGDADGIVDDDFILGGGATFWPADWPVGIGFDIAFAEYDFSDEVIRAINDAIGADPENDGTVDGGDVTVWQVVLDATWSPGDTSRGFYVNAGIGAYFLDGRVTSTELVYYPPICDPWFWWWCLPGGVGPGTVVRGSDSTTEFGWSVGFGYSFPLATMDSEVYVEAKYHVINTDLVDTEYVPITIGYRF